MRYCTKCVYPSISAAPLTFDERGVCSGCRVAEQRRKIDWAERGRRLGELLEQYRGQARGGQYDCIVPVSGGKDSYYQTHLITQVYGLKPLLVTYHGNNFLPCGLRNLERMREVFDCDHLIFRPSVKTLLKLNRYCFKKMGDMNWHAHCGIFTYPVQIAVKHRVPLLIWGEHGYTDLAGMYSMSDFIEMTAKFRLEHAQRGYDWFDMIEESEQLREQDLLWAKYPTDDELDDVGVRGIYIGNYVDWEANTHARQMKELYGWEDSPEPFDRTYRRFSNLDDMHENGIHDYLKYVKFGYGRATDHACKDIRAGLMTREQGVAMIRKYDHIKPRDLDRWLDYVGMTEPEFDRIADSFRDPRVWRRDEHGHWVKDNLWGEGTPASVRVVSQGKPTPPRGSTMKESEIRPDELMAGQQERHTADVQRLLARRSEFVEVPCPACGGERRAYAFSKYDLTFFTCADCATVYETPRPNPDLLAHFYATSENYGYWAKFIFPASEEVRREKIFKPRAERVRQICDAQGVGRGTLLEVGAGFGTFCEEIKRLQRFARVIGVEPTPDLAEGCRKRGLEVIEKPIEQVDPASLTVDVVASFEVIEHLFAPHDFVQNCYRVLNPGGLLVLSCPNVKGFDVALLREKSSTVDCEHLNLFHPASLSHLLKRSGFDVLETSTPGQLDAELVRKEVLAGRFSLEGRPFLQRILIDEWDRNCDGFQRFLVESGMSSHMWIVARKRAEPVDGPRENGVTHV